MTFWQKQRTIVDSLFLLVGAILTIYIAISAFGYIRNSSEHYSNFILGTVIMAGLMGIRDLCDEKIADQGKRFFAIRMVFTVVALVAATRGELRLAARDVALHLTALDIGKG
jgi:hypothetical protein